MDIYLPVSSPTMSMIAHPSDASPLRERSCGFRQIFSSVGRRVRLPFRPRARDMQCSPSPHISAQSPSNSMAVEHMAPHHGPVKSKQSGKPSERTPVCDICLTHHTASELSKPCHCGAAWCTGCLKALFKNASTRLGEMPPACCRGVLPLHIVIPYLTKKEAKNYRDRFDEWSSTMKVYCPVPTCSTFIPERLIVKAEARSRYVNGSADRTTSVDSNVQAPPESEAAQGQRKASLPTFVACPKCKVEVCLSCKQRHHPGRPCSNGIDPKVSTLIRKLGYKTCPACGTGIRRMFGCVSSPAFPL